MSHEHDREFYRVRHPDAAAPRFMEGDLTYRVVDIVTRVEAGEVEVKCAKRAIPLAVVLHEQPHRQHYRVREST